MTPGIAFATYLVLAVALFGLFAGSSRRLDAGTRGHMRRWIFREPGASGREGDREWAAGFVRWFDHAFKVRTRRLPLVGEIALPSFRRSVLVSFLSLLVLAVVWVCNKPGLGRALDHNEMTPHVWDQIGRLFLVYGGATLITNWIPDYLSLIESRFIMAKMARASSWTRRVAWLVVDAAATVAISFFAIHIGMILLLPLVTPAMDIEVGCLTPAGYSLETTWSLFVAGLSFESPAGTLNYDATGIYIYSTFLTSLWVWIYLGGSFALRTIFALRARLTSNPAAAHDHPLRTMGILVVIVFSAIFWPSWAQRRAHSADVYIHHAAADTHAARELATQLEAGGLRVRTRADSDTALAVELLARADTVIVLDSPASTEDTERVAGELYMRGECGERPWGSSARVSVGDSTRDGVFVSRQVADRYGPWLSWQPGEDAAEIVKWAQQANPLLHPQQVRACQAVDPWRDRAPVSCEDVGHAP